MKIIMWLNEVVDWILPNFSIALSFMFMNECRMETTTAKVEMATSEVALDGIYILTFI